MREGVSDGCRKVGLGGDCHVYETKETGLYGYRRVGGMDLKCTWKTDGVVKKKKRWQGRKMDKWKGGSACW